MPFGTHFHGVIPFTQKFLHTLWILFTFSNEFIGRTPCELRDNYIILEMLSLYLFFVPFIFTIIYIFTEEKLLNKTQVSAFKFNAFIIACWIIITIITTALVHIVGGNKIGFCDNSLECSSVSFIGTCFLSGIEYAIMAIFLGFQAIVLIIWKIIANIYKFFMNKKKLEKKDKIILILGIIVLIILICLSFSYFGNWI